jgi:long-chain acyl-CoA synthetase
MVMEGSKYMPEEIFVVQERFEKIVSKFPDKVSITVKKDAGGWQKLTFKEVHDLSRKAGALLIKEGFKHKDFGVIISENRPEWGMVYMGMMYAGLACVPLDPQFTTLEIDNVINDCQAKVLFVSSLAAVKISQKVREQLKVFVIDKDFISRLDSITLDGISWPHVVPDDMASLIYTSGTTGQPKGVMLTHLNFCDNVNSIDGMAAFPYLRFHSHASDAFFLRGGDSVYGDHQST